jgi:peptide chain release factor subunit 1
MITRRDLERLSRLTSDHGIVSVYIKIDPVLGYDWNQPEAKFKGSASRFVRESGDEGKAAVLERERDRIMRYLEGWKPNGRALVIFSCEPDDIWEVINLDVILPSFVTVDNTTHIGLLARVVDEYPRMAVAMVEGDAARVYVSEQRKGEQRSEIRSDVPGRHDEGGWSQARFQRHIDFHGAKHLQKVADEVQKLYQTEGFHQLVLVGVSENVTDLKRMLPGQIARRVIGDFSVDFKKEPDDQVLERARKVRSEHERSAELGLVQRIINDADAGGQAVVGIDETIQAVFEGRADTAAVADGVTAEGSLCPNCEYFSAQRFERCPTCNAEARPLPEAIEYTMERAYLSGAHVNVVFEEAREALLARGGLGAVLRY